LALGEAALWRGGPPDVAAPNPSKLLSLSAKRTSAAPPGLHGECAGLAPPLSLSDETARRCLGASASLSLPSSSSSGARRRPFSSGRPSGRTSCAAAGCTLFSTSTLSERALTYLGVNGRV
jgi:hypothetical protein